MQYNLTVDGHTTMLLFDSYGFAWGWGRADGRSRGAKPEREPVTVGLVIYCFSPPCSICFSCAGFSKDRIPLDDRSCGSCLPFSALVAASGMSCGWMISHFGSGYLDRKPGAMRDGRKAGNEIVVCQSYEREEHP